MFEGYDVLILGLTLPHIGKEFNINSEALGYAVGLISVGTVLAFALVGLADRYGRRAIFLGAVTGCTIFTVLTALSAGLYDFVAYQFIARLFMVTEIGVAAIILTEEMPSRYRGLAVTMVFGLVLFGGITSAMIYPIAVKSEFGWRGLYFLSGAVLPLLLFYWTRFQETQRWQKISAPCRQSAPVDTRQLQRDADYISAEISPPPVYRHQHLVRSECMERKQLIFLCILRYQRALLGPGASWNHPYFGLHIRIDRLCYGWHTG